MSTKRLLGRKCLISGGSSGIGLAIGRRFAAEGASRVILVGRNEEKLELLRKGHDAEGLRNIEYHAGDVLDYEMWRGVSGKMPDVDVLVNAAGVAQNQILFKTAPEVVEEVLGINLRGTINGAQVIAKAMVAQRKLWKEGQTGCIINVSSLLGLKGGRGATVYAASKAGVVGFTRAFALEMSAYNIRVNAIVPGYIDTRMTKEFPPNVADELARRVPLKRFGTPQEVADAAVFLASNEYANNCVLNLDGGLSAT